MDMHGRIVCFGEALIDMLAQPPATPDAPRAFLQFAGGAPANVSVAVARLGGDSHFVGMLGNDMFGDFLLQSLREAGVATDGVVRTDEARTALAFVALDARGERSFSFYRPPSADMLFRAAHFDRLGFEDVVRRAREAWDDGGASAAAAAIPGELFSDVQTVTDDLDAVVERLRHQARAGIDVHPIDLVGLDTRAAGEVYDALHRALPQRSAATAARTGVAS